MTLEQVEASLALWIAALDAVSRNRSYTIEGRQLTRADAKECRETIDWLQRKKSELLDAAAGRGRVRYVS